MAERLLLALDFGGTKHTAAVLVAGAREWRAHRRAFSPEGADAESDLETMRALARAALARAAPSGARPAALGVSFGGPVDFGTGTVRLSHHVPGWEEVPLRAILEDEFNAPAAVDNDANVAALGEHAYGAGRGADHLLYVTVSTGVGGGWILNGRPWRGAEGMAGEIGHTVVDPAGPRCLCGKRGCVERLASGPYMAQDARERLRAGEDEGALLLQLAGGDPEAINGALLSEAAARGDKVAREILERGAWALGVGIGNAANLINPQRVVLGGGVTKAGDGWWQVVRRTVAETTLPEVNVEVVPAGLGDDAPLWGAAVLAESVTSA
ncbi:MAG: ROK family protein [Candidatus Promineifilaceae bacterium]|nr:ROK family protein [Candidatus Promineifilaceae bacterium]